MTPSVSPEGDRELIEGGVYIRDDELRVVAIAHHRQRPDYWMDRT